MIGTVSFKETSLINTKSLLFSLLIVLCSLLIAACDLFTGPKVDVFQLISDEVDYAAAPWVPLRIETNGLGITSPPPQTHDKLVKLGYSFKLSIVPDSDYPFRGWEAWVEGQGIRSIWKNDLGEQNSAHHPERVRFEPLNANGTEVEVFVYEMPPDGKRLVIGPLGATNDELIVIPNSGELGSIFPARLSGVKRGFPFTMNFQPSSAYPFRGWQALFFNSSDTLLAESSWEAAGGEIIELRDNGVLWSPRNATGLEMNVTIEETPVGFSTADGYIVIGPLGMDSGTTYPSILASAAWGITNPPPGMQSEKKLGFPFTVEFTVASGWEFKGWKAYYYDGINKTIEQWRQDNPRELLGDEITIIEPGGGRAEVTVYTGKAVTLVPYCIERPYVKTHNLPNHFDDRKITNYPIRLWFNEEIHPDCYNAENWAANFKITARGNYGFGAEIDLNCYYKQPVANKEQKLITIAKDLDALGDFYNLNITLELNLGGIYDIYGTPMGESGQYRELFYGVSATTYDKPPETINLEAVCAGGMFSADNAISLTNKDYYVKNEKNENDKRTVYLLFDKDEVVDPAYTQLRRVKVTEIMNDVIKESNDNVAHLSSEGGIYAELAQMYKEKNNGKEPYIVLYELDTDADGEIQLAVQPVDEFENVKSYAAANKINMILDTTPPAPITNANITVSGSGTNLSLAWTYPNDPGLDSVLISWGIAGEVQHDPELIQGLSNIFPNVAQNTFYTFSFKTVDFAGNESTQNTMVAAYNCKKAYIVANTSEWSSAVTAINADDANKENAIFVEGNFIIPGRTANTFTPSGITVNISGDNPDRTITLSSGSNNNGSLLRIGSGQTVTMANLTLQGRSGNNNSLVYVNGGTFNMNSGTVKGNTTTGNGGGVYIVSGTFNMNGGTISGNNASGNASYGGGVYLNSGAIFTMYRGTISDNNTRYGGGVCVGSNEIRDTSTHFEMNDGTIYGNTALYGGGVFVEYGSTSMINGEILRNNATYGGGVSLGFVSTFTMSGGDIRSNSASDAGGGVNINRSSGTFTMESGTISYNYATKGGGVQVENSTLGGGVQVENSTFTMSGTAKISNNIVTNAGGGVNMDGGNFNMSGGTISSNQAIWGGGVHMYNNSGSIFRISNGTIHGSNEPNTALRNTVPNSGGGASLCRNNCIAQYESGSTWNNISNNIRVENTINVVNGVLQ